MKRRKRSNDIIFQRPEYPPYLFPGAWRRMAWVLAKSVGSPGPKIWPLLWK